MHSYCFGMVQNRTERCKQETDFPVHFTLAYQAQIPSPRVTSSSCIMYLTSYVRTKRKKICRTPPAAASESGWQRQMLSNSSRFHAAGRSRSTLKHIPTTTVPIYQYTFPHTNPEDFCACSASEPFPNPCSIPKTINHRPTSFLHVPCPCQPYMTAWIYWTKKKQYTTTVVAPVDMLAHPTYGHESGITPSGFNSEASPRGGR